MLESMCKSFITGLVSLIPAGASATSVRAAYGITARNILFVALRCILAKNCTRRHYFERYAHRCVRRGPLPRGAPRVRGHIGAYRRQVDRAGGRRARAWTDALQPDLQAGRGYFATHADADAEEPGARWPCHANGLPDESATGGL